MSERHEVLALLPWVVQKVSPTVNEDDAFIAAAVLMAFRQIDFLPVLKDMHVVGGFSGLEAVGTLSEVGASRRGVTLVEKRVGQVCGKAIQISPRDSLASLLNSMIEAHFGRVCVVEGGELVATISLKDLVQYASSLKLRAGLRVRELASSIASLPCESTVTELLSTLLRKRIRRVVVSGLSQPAVCDDRVLAQVAFSHEGLMTIRDTPERFFQRRLSSLPLVKPGSLGGDVDVAEAWSNIYGNPAECLLVKGEDKILTPWDVVLKPYTIAKFQSNHSKKTLSDLA